LPTLQSPHWEEPAMAMIPRKQGRFILRNRQL
jgi:hypothetical protein